MGRRWGIGAALVVVVLIAAGTGYRVGSRHPASGSHVADAPRLQVAAWGQEWSTDPGAPPAELFVAPGGEGTSCRRDAPCALEVAQQQARALAPVATTDVVVTLAGGDYHLDAPFALQAPDSGHGGHLVRYRAAPGDPAVLHGGRPVTGWRPAASADGSFVADVPVGTSSRQLYVEGVRATRARGPVDPAGWARTEGGFRAPDDSLARWARPQDAEIVSLAEWRAFRCPIGAVQGAEVSVAQPCWRNASAPSRFAMTQVSWLENARELLDEPGEWYLDAAAGQVWYRPRPGEDLAMARVTLATDGPLLTIEGSATDPVHDVGVEGLTFAFAGWDAPSADAGYAAAQAGFHRGAEAGPDPLDLERVPGAVQIGHARHVRIERATFTHLGGAGLDLTAGAQDIGVVGNRFTDISGTAIQMGEVRQGAQNPVPADQLDRLQVTNNLIDHAAVEYLDSVGIFASYVSNTSIQHNELAHLPYSGISLGWGWGTDSTARNDVIGANLVTDVMTTLQDGGAIYTLSPLPGSLIERNVIRDQRNRSGAIFLDEGTAFVTVADNVIERVPRWLHIWIASVHDNTIVDNDTDTAEQVDDGTRNVVARNHTDRADWPPSAAAVIAGAGLEPDHTALRDPTPGPR